MLAEELYERLITASRYSGSKLKKFPPTPYSPTIARLRNVHRLLKLAVTQFKTSCDLSETIARIKAKLWHAGYELPNTLEMCTLALLNCTRQLKAAIQEELETRNLQRQHQDNLIQGHEAAGTHKVGKENSRHEKGRSHKANIPKVQSGPTPRQRRGLNTCPCTCRSTRKPKDLHNLGKDRLSHTYGQPTYALQPTTFWTIQSMHPHITTA